MMRRTFSKKQLTNFCNFWKKTSCGPSLLAPPPWPGTFVLLSGPVVMHRGVKGSSSSE